MIKIVKTSEEYVKCPSCEKDIIQENYGKSYVAKCLYCGAHSGGYKQNKMNKHD